MTDFTDFRGRTERMRLRPYGLGDFDEFADLHGREEVARYLPWETRDADASRVALGKHQDMRLALDRDSISLAGFDVDTGRLAGEFVLIMRSVVHRGVELGYVVHPDFQGRGLAVEGARAILEIAFDLLGLHRVVARIDVRNRGSAAVLRRLGMRQEALLVKNELFKGEWGDEADYAMLEEEWAVQGTSTLLSWTGIEAAPVGAEAPLSPPA